MMPQKNKKISVLYKVKNEVFMKEKIKNDFIPIYDYQIIIFIY